MDCHDNCIEWVTGETRLHCTFSQKKFINKVKKLAEKFPDQVTIKHVNNDGTINAYLPLDFLKLFKRSKANTTEEENEESDTEND